jgi:galactokinase
LKLLQGELTQVAIYSERYSGVQAGGMDQSISIMAPRGSPLIIHFYPKLAAEPIHFSNVEPVFVIANTLVTANKHETAPTNYNLRVVETRLAAALLAKQLDLTMKTPVFTLREVQEAYALKTNKQNEDFCSVLETLMAHVEKNFKQSLYSGADIASLLNTTV